MTFAVVPFDAPLGAEIIGLDFGAPPGATELARVRQALLDHLLIVFRDARITPAQHVSFARIFGPLQIHVLGRAGRIVEALARRARRLGLLGT